MTAISLVQEGRGGYFRRVRLLPNLRARLTQRANVNTGRHAPAVTALDAVRSPRSLFAREPDWHFSLMLTLEVAFLFVALPALATGEADRNLLTLLQFGLVATAIGLIADNNTLRLGLAASFGVILFARWDPGVVPRQFSLSMVFACNLLLTGAVARAVFGAGEVNHHRIAGAVFVYLNIAVLFALAYSFLQTIMPDALNGVSLASRTRADDIMHFSLTTLTAIGDPHVSPNIPVARSLADLETIIGQLFPAILLSRLVGLHLSRGSNAS